MSTKLTARVICAVCHAARTEPTWLMVTCVGVATRRLPKRRGLQGPVKHGRFIPAARPRPPSTAAGCAAALRCRMVRSREPATVEDQANESVRTVPADFVDCLADGAIHGCRAASMRDAGHLVRRNC